jgi:subtilisin family serine protease
VRLVWLLAALALASAAVAAFWAKPARGDDSQPTQWQIDANAEVLQHAPEPPVKPVICVIDFGVTPTPDLDIVHRQALDGGTLDDVTATPGNFGHGTTVAHMAAGKVNGWGASGVFPHARIASVRIFSKPGERVPWQGYINALQRCLSIEPRPAVALLSIGGSLASENEAADLANQIRIARRYMSVVAAAGNGGARADMPARLPAVLSVAAATSVSALCDFSARDETVDLMAPGCGLTQSGWNGVPWLLNGTSFAAPIVAGALAALRAYQPHLSVDAAEDILASATRTGPVPRLDVDRALQQSGVALGTPPRPLATANAALSTRSEAGDREGHSAETPTQPAHRAPRLNVSPAPGAKGPRPSPPRVSVHRRGGHLVLRIHNRPFGTAVEVRSGRYRVRRRSSRIRLPRRIGAIRARFVSELGASPWARLFRSSFAD